MGEIKQTNFRVDTDTADAFRAFCTEHGMNQAQGFDHLIQILELNNAKIATPGRITEIEAFEKLVKDILAAYINSIELSNNAESRVKEHFHADLKRKDQVIDELQAKIKQLTEEKEEHDKTVRKVSEENHTLQEQIQHITEQMDVLKKSSADQEQIHAMLKSQLNELSQKLSDYDIIKKSETALRSEIMDLKYKFKETEAALSHETELHKSDIKDFKLLTEKYKALETSETNAKMRITELERQIIEKEADAKNRLAQLQIQADLEKERAIIAKERELQDEIRKLDRENAKLSLELEQLETKIKK